MVSNIRLHSFQNILSDPLNAEIPRVENAGEVIDGHIVMHNGIKINDYSYYEEFSHIFKINGGVHEPQEERVFMDVLQEIDEGGTIIELGAYWGFYSLWFNQVVKNAKVYLIEPIEEHLELGKKNFELNNATADFTHAAIGPYYDSLCMYIPPPGTPIISIDEFVKTKNIDHISILHSDIQAAEHSMLINAEETFTDQKVDYAFISTHNDYLHNVCTEFLLKHGYEIIASANVSKETFCGDGVLVGRLKTLKDNITPYELGNRSETELITIDDVSKKLRGKGL